MIWHMLGLWKNLTALVCSNESVVRIFVMPVDKSSDRVRRMFGQIAWRYDFLNHLLSLGIDHYWRWKAIRILKKENPQLILDAATGTGALAMEAVKLNPAKIFGIDISEDMLKIGRAKIKAKKLNDKIE